MNISKLRKSAMGQPCTFQIYPDCNSNPETSVLCHLNSPGKGMGQKSPDFFAGIGCSSCHDIIDGRAKPSKPISAVEMEQIKLRALYRTWLYWFKCGYIQ